MASFSARRFRSACAISATALVALALPGIAAAKKSDCNGLQSFVGAGSTLQKTAQLSVWGPDFHSSSTPVGVGCPSGHPGEEPTLTTYESIGSGPGMEKWGLNGKAFNPAFDFVATDEAPNTGQEGEISTAASGAQVQTLPVLQAAVAFLVHLPEGCTATSKPDPGRLVLTNGALQKVWRNGEIKDWTELVEAVNTEDPAAEDKLIESVPPKCDEADIKRWVRDEESGTTHILKKYLGLDDEEKVGSKEVEKKNLVMLGGPFTWTEISEGSENPDWPTADAVHQNGNVTEPNTAGGGNLVEAVLSVPSSVGYAALTDARAKEGKKLTITGEFEEVESPVGSGKFVKVGNGKTFHPGTGGAGTETFWTPIENGANAFADPSSDNELSATARESNCTEEAYTNSEKTFPPKKASDPWNEVTTSLTETNYTLCGLTFDLGLSTWKAFGAKEAEVEKTIGAYYRYELSEAVGGGQEAIKNHDYESLTKQLDGIAAKEVKKFK